MTATLLTLTTGCGMRLETPEPPAPTPDAAEVIRSEAVADATAIAQAAQAAQTDPAAVVVTDRLAQVAAGSLSHAETLGGTWTASGTSEGTTTPDATPSATAPTAAGDLPAAITSLTSGYERARAGLAGSSGDTTQILASMALWRALAAHELAGAIPETAPELPRGGIDGTALSLATFRDVDPLVRGLDAAAYAYEVLAAREDDAGRQASWKARAGTLRETGELVAGRAGVAGTAADPRVAVYDVSSLVTADATTSAVGIETDVARLWITSDLPASARGIGVDAALEALLRARQLAPTSPLDSPAVVLPGLVG